MFKDYRFMSNTVIGTLKQVLSTVEGESARGPWIKCGFVVETEGEYPTKVAFTCFGEERVNTVRSLTLGQKINVTFTPESREFNDRWYTDLRCIKIETLTQ